MNAAVTPFKEDTPSRSMKPLRIGFVGTGWIGQNRLKAVIDHPCLEPIAIVEPDLRCANNALAITHNKAKLCSFDELVQMRPEGIVLATPNDMHAKHAVSALEHGIPVFCQKPLGRDFLETHHVIDAARRANRLLRVDLSYRYLEGIRQIWSLLRTGELGFVYDIDLKFHNGYGPTGAWFYDRNRSGGGCLIDLGIHLVDLTLWMLNYPEILDVKSDLFTHGESYRPGTNGIEDHAVASLSLSGGRVAHLACSWKANAGRGAVIEMNVFGTKGGACLRNVEGSFFDFIAERFQGTERTAMSAPPDDWCGRALSDWIARLQLSHAFDADVEQMERVALALDRIYNRCAS